MYRDSLKETIKYKISQVLDIPVKDSVIDTKKQTGMSSYPKMLFKSYISDTEIEVIDYDKYDIKGKEVPPILDNVVGLYICNATKKSKVVAYDESKGVITLADNQLGSKMVEYINELIIETDNQSEDSEDYIFITSLHNFSRRLSDTLVEDYRRFQIGVFCNEDPNENKCNYYMEVLRKEFDRDFQIIDSEFKKTKEIAYIFNPVKFDVEENGKLNRVVYGSVMIKTYK
ncbi:MAG: hypothetical protein ACRDBY_04775 [Cetobacterium sp.]